MQRKNNIKSILVLVILASCHLTFAQDIRTPPVKGRILNTRTSPFAPPEDTDRSFSTDKGPKLDTGCIFRNEGPIKFNIEVKRYLGPLKEDGTLMYPQKLIDAGIVSKDVMLIMETFDVDSSGGGQGVQPELDRITVNGIEYGFLKGQDNQWVQNAVPIPISKIKFAKMGIDGSEPAPGINEIQIDIDTANSGEEWCTSIDWGNVRFKAMSPIILIHGNGSDGCFFDRQKLTVPFDEKGIVYDRSIQLNPNEDSTNPCPSLKGPGTLITGSISTNGKKLDTLIPKIARQLGARNIHLIAHSKGGLDAREYLANYQPFHDADFKILSLTTLGTPHNGSVLADISLASITAFEDPNILADGVDLEGFPGWTETSTFLVNFLGVDEGRKDLRTFKAAEFNRNNLPYLNRGIAFHAIGGDADINESLDIDSFAEYEKLETENRSLRVFVPGALARRIVNSMYQNLRLNRTVIFGQIVERCSEIRPGIVICRDILIVKPDPNPLPLKNDTLVTIPSALGENSFQLLTSHSRTFDGSGGRNHSNIANEEVGNIIIPWLIELDTAKGGLK